MFPAARRPIAGIDLVRELHWLATEEEKAMAYYEFQCTHCRKHFTLKQTFAEHDREPKPKCPKCSSRKVNQLIGSVHVKTSKKS